MTCADTAPGLSPIEVTADMFLCCSEPVQRFFCFDDPPGPFDTIEESRVESLYTLRVTP